ncbi:MAG: DUF2314 domain-containing protein [Hyphomonas sp.]|nr:DUF2314 domain-containing protein [Hyphomonas sp.]
MKRIGLALMMFALAACGAETKPEPGPPPLYKYQSMKTAVEEARQTLPVFWDAYRSGDGAYSNFALNVVTQSKRYDAEYVWLVDIKEREGRLEGTVPEDHEIDDGLKSGTVIAFLPGQIADWRYREDGRTRGAYTTRAMLDLAPNADTSNIRALFHDSPVP